MKLGDNMAATEACSVWSDVCPRKSRPPRIGDIPRHVAIDEEESPSSSSHLPVTPGDITKPILKTPVKSHGNTDAYVTQKSLLPPQLTEFQQTEGSIFYGQPSVPITNNNAIPKCLETRAGKILTKISSFEKRSIRSRLSIASGIRVTRSSTLDSSIITHGTVVSRLLSVKEKLSSTIGSLDSSSNITTATSNVAGNRETLRNPDNKEEKTDVKYGRSYLRENLIVQQSCSLEKSDDDIDWDSRKDSAVCLEDTEELDALKERILQSDCFESKASSTYKLPPLLLTTQKVTSITEDTDDTIDDKSIPINHPSLAKYYPRPRRESSGYCSNLSTFDEDRRSSTTADSFQSLAALNKERRRSSVKRLNLGSRLGREDVESERMPTSEVYRKISTAGLEMPNITELKEITEDVVRCSTKADLVCLPTIDAFTDIKVGKDRRRFGKKIFTDKNNDDTSEMTLEIIKERATDIDQTKENIFHEILYTACSDATIRERDIEEIKERLSQSTLTGNTVTGIDKTGESCSVCQDEFVKSSSIVAMPTIDTSSKTVGASSLVQRKPDGSRQLDRLRQQDDANQREKESNDRLKGNENIEKISSTNFQLKSSQNPNVPETAKTPSLKFLKHLVTNASTCGPNPKAQQRTSKRIIHQYSSPLSTTVGLESIDEKPQNDKSFPMQPIMIINDVDDDNDVEICNKISEKDNGRVNILPRSVKVYQLLSTQSEDHGDDEPRLMDRRISLQITRHDEEESLPCTALCAPQDKKLLHADTSPLLQVPPNAEDNEHKGISRLTVDESGGSGDVKEYGSTTPVRKLSSPGEVEVIQRMMGDNGNVGIRPIYPYCPYSPYGSPQGSPRIRRRPLRESRRVSIDNRQGTFQLNQYKLLDTIGQGSYGIVKLAYNEEDDTHYAMKILSKKKLMKKAGIFGRMAPGRKGISANPLAKVYREIALLKKLDHPNVVKLVEVLDDPDEDNLYLVFELVQKGEVLQLPTDKPLDEETARINFRDVVLGVEYLHYQRIVHRDIKPSNLLVDSEGHIKIADLGVSAELRASGELLSGSAGTPAFAAPETTIPGAQYSGTLCDVWSMGVTLYTLVTGKVPWDGSGSIIGVQAAIRSEPLRFPEDPQLSEDLRDLISRMLAKDPATRCSLQEIKTHRWLTNHGKEPLPSEADNCRLPVTVTDEEVARVVTRVPKLDTLILIKTMLKQHSFQNPFLSKRIAKPSGGDSLSNSNVKLSSTSDGDVVQTRDLVNRTKTAQFHRAGRSNSAPDSYNWQKGGRQASVDTPLSPVTEVSVPEVENGKR